MGNAVSGTIDEKDRTLTVKVEDKDVRYVLESDLLALKEGRKSKEDVTKEVEAAKAGVLAEAATKIEAEHQKALQAEARVSSLEEKIARGGVDSAELVKAKAELESAKLAEKSSATKLLEVKRTLIIGTYGVPKETVASKDLAALETFEEALKAVMGNKGVGNYALASGGGANPLEGKSPSELAHMFYEKK